jgi:hypothetical protein
MMEGKSIPKPIPPIRVRKIQAGILVFTSSSTINPEPRVARNHPPNRPPVSAGLGDQEPHSAGRWSHSEGLGKQRHARNDRTVTQDSLVIKGEVVEQTAKNEALQETSEIVDCC